MVEVAKIASMIRIAPGLEDELGVCWSVGEFEIECALQIAK